MSTQKQASFTVSPPRHGEAQDLEGRYVTLAFSQNFISTSKTLVQIGMICYLEFVFSSYEKYFIVMEHTRLESADVQFKD